METAKAETIVLLRSGRHVRVAVESLQRRFPGARVVVVAQPSAASALDLAGIAPCHAVAGNCDADPALPLTCQQEVVGVRFLVHHGHLPVDVARFRPHVVVTGHTHVPKIERVGDVLYVNPGSAGPRRFNLPVTVARVTIRDGHAQARLIPLEVA